MHSDARTDYEAKLLYEHIKHFSFFQTFNERNAGNNFESEAFSQLCKNAKYEKLPPGRVIFKQGDTSDGKMYIVYSGEVAVVTKNLDLFAKENAERLNNDKNKVNETGGFFPTEPTIE